MTDREKIDVLTKKLDELKVEFDSASSIKKSEVMLNSSFKDTIEKQEIVNLKLSENIVHQFFKKAKGFLDTSKVNIEMYAHQRDKKFSKKDWIHNDLCVGDYTCLIYLSKTNLKSGTKFYSDTKKVIHDVSFVQNRAIIFDSRYLHSAYGHHDGRLNVLLTINK